METSTHSNNPWFVVSVGLMGLILGYGISSAQNSFGLSGTSAQVAQVAQQPTGGNDPAPTPAAPADVPEVDPDTDHIRGNPDAQITVIEYSDFECPFCKSFAPTTDKILETYGDKVNLVYRHFPLSFHQNAQKEAEASECVAELGGNDAFWKFHDYVFTHTTSNGLGFALDQLPVAAQAAGVDTKKFQDCFDSGKFTKKVEDQMAGGSTAGVNGTPGSFVKNNKTGEIKTVEGAVPFANFQTIIDGMLAAK